MEQDNLSVHIMLGFLLSGFLLMGLGFQYRESRGGLIALACGSATLLSTIAYRIYLALY